MKVILHHSYSIQNDANSMSYFSKAFITITSVLSCSLRPAPDDISRKESPLLPVASSHGIAPLLVSGENSAEKKQINQRESLQLPSNAT